MLQKSKYIQSIALLLFLGAWMLQSVTSVLMQQGNAHHNKVMSCSINAETSRASCSLDGTQSCACNHAAAENDGNTVTLCGCDDHANPMGMSSPFQIKAPLLAAVDNVAFTAEIVSTHTNQSHYFIFSDDIFHPPRLNA